MKIGLLHYSMPPAIGGVERVIAAHAALFQADGHEVILFSEKTSPETSFPTLAVPGFGNSGDFSENVVAFCQFIRRQQLDFLLVHNVLTMPFCLAATVACRELALDGPPLVSWIHDLAADNPDYTIGLTEPETWLREHPPGAHVVAVSQARADAYRQMTGRQEVLVIPNGIDALAETGGDFLIKRPELRENLASAFPILFLPSRILRRKNILLAIQTVAELKKNGLQPRLLLSGAAESFTGKQSFCRQELDQAIATHDLSAEIHFLSDRAALSDREISDLYQLSDALFFPSKQEGFGLPILEASARGLPIFASETLPLAALAAQNGLIFSPAIDPRDLAERISVFLAENAASHIRRSIRRDFNWQGLYRRLILPLLLRFFQMTSTLSSADLNQLLGASHRDPFSVLGPQKAGDGLCIRAFQPDADKLEIIDKTTGEVLAVAAKVHPDGLFEAILPNSEISYALRIHPWQGEIYDLDDAYSFGRVLGEMDTHLFAEGNHYQIYKKLGAHLKEISGVKGVAFAVWAPNAQRISVVGEFNGWDGRVNPMRKLVESGIWELFIPGVGEGTHYKFEVRGAGGQIQLKSDPFAFYGQHSEKTASLVFDLNRYVWDDEVWMTERAKTDWQNRPVSIYEVHLGSWQRVPEENNRSLSYRELADRLLNYVLEMGYTHIELMPVSEFPFDGSWGYQVTGYYAITSRFGNPDEFRYFVDRCHQAGVGIILDWVPGHFPKDAHGLAQFDGTALFEHADPRQGEHRDWGTLIFNYGRNEVRNFLIGNALFLMEEYHIDGLRVDAVASMLYLDYSRKADEWVPNVHGGRENLEAIHFLKRFNEVCYAQHPGIMTMAEESTSWPGVSRPTYLGGLGFGFKWNMGWMHDFLSYMEREPVYRRHHQGEITFSMVYAFNEHFVLVLSHDEVVHGKGSLIEKMPGDEWQKFANLRFFYGWMYAHPGKKLLFQGQEFGQWKEWAYAKSLDWHLCALPLHDGLKRLVQHLNHLYRTEPALYEIDTSYDGFEWIDFHDADNSVVAFLRKDRGDNLLIFVVNATPIPREGYRIGVPKAGFYEEILNTDAATYGGSNLGNFGGLSSQELAWQGRDHSLQINLPPLATIGFRWRKE